MEVTCFKSRRHAGDIMITIACNSMDAERAAGELVREVKETVEKKNRREKSHGGGFGYTVKLQKD